MSRFHYLCKLRVMRRLPRNSCTTFAAIGAVLAYSVLIPAFGPHWELIPGGVAGLIAGYAVSTMLGSWLDGINIRQHIVHRIIAGVGAALLTLLTGALAITTTNFLLQTGIDVTGSPAGQPFWNAVAEFAPRHFREFVVEAVLVGLLYGQLPAILLGVAFGAMLRRASPAAQTTTPRASGRVYAASAGSALMALLFAGATTLMTDGQNRRAHVPIGVPVAISGCGTVDVADDVLGFCPGSPCEQGYCEWDTEIDAIAAFVQRPENSKWKWTGGGMGNTSSPHIVRHNTRWVQPGPDGYFDGSNPHRHASYEFRFDGETVRIQGHSFEFVPGMLLVIRYSDDWSYTVGVGPDALIDTNVTIDQLQAKLDEFCASLGVFDLCSQSFRIGQ